MSLGEAAGRLGLKHRLDGGVAVVTVTGEVDVFTTGLLREGLLGVIAGETGPGLVVNLAAVSFLDSTGTGVLVGVLHRVRAAGGRLAVAAPSRQARAILAITGLDRVFPVYDGEAEAVQACRRPPAPG
jgi:anti-sigma B factor antagonist